MPKIAEFTSFDRMYFKYHVLKEKVGEIGHRKNIHSPLKIKRSVKVCEIAPILLYHHHRHNNYNMNNKYN